MPAAKDFTLLKGNLTKGQKEQKQKDKASVTPSIMLAAPDIIRNDVSLYTIWEHTLKLYEGTELLNALDEQLLARYCIETNALNLLYKRRGKRMAIDTMLKIETRIEAKTKMLNQMALALYMTPRARAGAVPNEPDKEAKDDPNAKMFD